MAVKKKSNKVGFAVSQKSLDTIQRLGMWFKKNIMDMLILACKKFISQGQAFEQYFIFVLEVLEETELHVILALSH